MLSSFLSLLFPYCFVDFKNAHQTLILCRDYVTHTYCSQCLPSLSLLCLCLCHTCFMLCCDKQKGWFLCDQIYPFLNDVASCFKNRLEMTAVLILHLLSKPSGLTLHMKHILVYFVSEGCSPLFGCVYKQLSGTVMECSTFSPQRAGPLCHVTRVIKVCVCFQSLRQFLCFHPFLQMHSPVLLTVTFL